MTSINCEFKLAFLILALCFSKYDATYLKHVNEISSTILKSVDVISQAEQVQISYSFFIIIQGEFLILPFFKVYKKITVSHHFTSDIPF